MPSPADGIADQLQSSSLLFKLSHMLCSCAACCPAVCACGERASSVGMLHCPPSLNIVTCSEGEVASEHAPDHGNLLRLSRASA